ncbi:MAG: hypothetical protein ACE14Q_06900 [Acidobacteriota bacterium]
MKGRRFFTVLTVVLAVTLFTTFAFGQVSGGGVGKDQQVTNAVLQSIDNVAVQLSDLQTSILNALGLFKDVKIKEDPSGTVTVVADTDSGLCDGKASLYSSALTHISYAWNYVNMAYELYYNYCATKNTRLLLKIGTALTNAMNELLIATTYFYEANAYTCS